MNDNIFHLTTSAAGLPAETDERRIRAIRSHRWALYSRAKQALDRLSALIDHPRGTRMPSVAIYSDSGMGKTMKRFRDEHPPSFKPLKGTLKASSQAMEMTTARAKGGSTLNSSPCAVPRNGRVPTWPRWNRRHCGSWKQ